MLPSQPRARREKKNEKKDHRLHMIEYSAHSKSDVSDSAWNLRCITLSEGFHKVRLCIVSVFLFFIFYFFLANLPVLLCELGHVFLIRLTVIIGNWIRLQWNLGFPNSSEMHMHVASGKKPPGRS